MERKHQVGQPESAVGAALVQELGGFEKLIVQHTDGGAELTAALAVVPKGKKIEDLRPFLEKDRDGPRRRSGETRIDSHGSFIELVNRFKDPESALFADDSDRKAPDITAIFDYHNSGPDGAARFGEHRARYDFPLSKEWKTWTINAESMMAQADFAAFLEQNVVDVRLPGDALKTSQELVERLSLSLSDPSELVAIARSLSVHTTGQCESAVNLQTGEVQMKFSEEHKTQRSGADFKVKPAFLIQIPVFKRGTLWEILVRLRYRLTNGKLSFFYTLHQAEACFDEAFSDACNLIQGQTGLPLFFGSHE